eukprot:sb/3462999/
MNSTTPLITTSSPLPTSPLPSLDIILGIICFLTAAVGVLGNLFVMKHFLVQKLDLPTLIYRLISFNDLITTLTVIPNGVSLVRDLGAEILTKTLDHEEHERQRAIEEAVEDMRLSGERAKAIALEKLSKKCARIQEQCLEDLQGRCDLAQQQALQANSEMWQGKLDTAVKFEKDYGERRLEETLAKVNKAADSERETAVAVAREEEKETAKGQLADLEEKMTGEREAEVERLNQEKREALAELEGKLRVEMEKRVVEAISKTEAEAMERLTAVKIDHDNEDSIESSDMAEFDPYGVTQTYTHNSILNLGAEILTKTLDHEEHERQRAIEEAVEDMRLSGERAKAIALEKLSKKCARIQEQCLEDLQGRCDLAQQQALQANSESWQGRLDTAVKFEKDYGERRLEETLAKVNKAADSERETAVVVARKEEKETAKGQLADLKEKMTGEREAEVERLNQEKREALAELEGKLRVEMEKRVVEAIAKTEAEAMERLTAVKIDHDNEISRYKVAVQSEKEETERVRLKLEAEAHARVAAEDRLKDVKEEFKYFINSLPGHENSCYNAEGGARCAPHVRAPVGRSPHRRGLRGQGGFQPIFLYFFEWTIHKTTQNSCFFQTKNTKRYKKIMKF